MTRTNPDHFSPDGIIFDIDGTLWDATAVVADAWNRVLKDAGLTPFLTADRLRMEFGKPLDTIALDLLPDIPDKKRKGILDIWVVVEPKAVLETQPHLYEGIENTLLILSRKYPLFIVTNAEQGYIETLYESTGFGKYFTDQICFGDTGRPKGENIRRIADRHRLKAPVYTGDTAGDLEAARLAGVRFVHAAYGYGTVPESECDFRIGQPSDLIALFS